MCVECVVNVCQMCVECVVNVCRMCGEYVVNVLRMCALSVCVYGCGCVCVWIN